MQPVFWEALSELVLSSDWRLAAGWAMLSCVFHCAEDILPSSEPWSGFLFQSMGSLLDPSWLWQGEPLGTAESRCWLSSVISWPLIPSRLLTSKLISTPPHLLSPGHLACWNQMIVAEEKGLDRLVCTRSHFCLVLKSGGFQTPLLLYHISKQTTNRRYWGGLVIDILDIFKATLQPMDMETHLNLGLYCVLLLF